MYDNTLLHSNSHVWKYPSCTMKNNWHSDPEESGALAHSLGVINEHFML